MGGRVVEITEEVYDEIIENFSSKDIFLWVGLKDTEGVIHHIRMDKIIEITNPNQK